MTHSSELNETRENRQKPDSNRTVRRVGKSHADFWNARLKRRTYVDRSGKRVEVPNWQVRLQKDRKEGWFNLGTANRAEAARKAKEVFTFLDANGWDATLQRFKPGADNAPSGKLTLGEYLLAVKASGQLRVRTFLNYQNCLRTIVSGVFGIRGGKAKFDYRTGGHKQWIDRIDGIRLERLTPERVTAWQRKFILSAGNSPAAIASAKRTANSYVRCARSLFAPGIRKAVKLALPSRLPFEGVELFESGSQKYISKIQVRPLITAARAELMEKDPEVYKAFLLGLFAGMRRAEIDSLEWKMIDWENNLIKLEETEWLHLKSSDSAGEIAVDSQVLADLRIMQKANAGRFVLISDRPPRNDSARVYYRCETVFDRLNEWLRGKGITANKPLHELRKEIGALVATQHGIYAASRFLRHSDITTTARHYAEHKTRISVGLGRLLESPVQRS